MRFLIYQIILIIVSPLMLMATIYQAIKRHGGMIYIAQRFGLLTPRPESISSWFHCASLGEVKTALPLIEALLEQSSDEKILVTSNTPTGKKILQHKIQTKLIHTYMPWDFSLLIFLFLRRIQPTRLIILETEIWPALYFLCHKRNIPITIINARLSKKTLNAPEFVKSLYKSSLLTCKKIICQSDAHAENFRQLTSSTAPIDVLNNLKLYTPEPKIDTTRTISKLTTRTHIVLFSSHDNEEITIAKICAAIDKNLLLVIIPRHPERRKSLLNTFKKTGFAIALRSKQEEITKDTQIYLADTIGEVQQLIYDAKICIVGGSFIPHGGQNFLEATALGKAVICGPYMDNFQEISDSFINNKALIQCSEADLALTVTQLLNNDKQRETLANTALQYSQQNLTIVNKYLEYLSD